MRVFIAGATGVLGRQVVRELIARGHQVVGLARTSLNEGLLRSLGALPAAGSLFDAENLTRAAAGADVVMHLATAIPVTARLSARDWKENDRVRVQGTSALLEAACRVRARFYLQQSAVSIHGDSGANWVDENSPLHPHPVETSLLTTEQLVHDVGTQHGLPWSILRAGSFYQADAAHTRALISGLRTGRLPVIGMGKNFQSLVHVDDMAHACVLAAQSEPAGETFLVVDDEPVRLRDLYTFVARQVGGPKLRYIPPLIARLTTGRLPVELAIASLRCRNSKLKLHLGWEPRFPTFREGFTEIMRATASGS